MEKERNLGSIIFRQEGFKAYIILNRPEKLNALTMEMYQTIEQLIDEIEVDPSIRVVILKGANHVFSSGYDISTEAEQSQQEIDIINARAQCKKTNSFRWKIWNSRKPYIAQLEKCCLGGGLSTVIACDFLIGGESLKIGEPEITFGAASGFLMIPWVCNLRKAKEALLTGMRFTGTQAAEMGLITRAVPDDQVEEEVEKLASQVGMVPPNSFALTKSGINHVYERMGIRQATEEWDDLSILNFFGQTEEVRLFNEVVVQKGVKAGLKWRDKYFASQQAK